MSVQVWLGDMRQTIGTVDLPDTVYTIDTIHVSRVTVSTIGGSLCCAGLRDLDSQKQRVLLCSQSISLADTALSPRSLDGALPGKSRFKKHVGQDLAVFHVVQRLDHIVGEDVGIPDSPVDSLIVEHDIERHLEWA